MGGVMKWASMKDVVPPGVSGETRVEHFTITEQQAERSRWREAATRGREQAVSAGDYVRLMVDGEVMMSDTAMERDTNYEIVVFAAGDVLIAGLGIGLLIPPLLSKKSVKKVTVIEKSADVIQLVEPHLRTYLGDRSKDFEVVQADIFAWEPPPRKKWDLIYFDIWPQISTANLKEMKTLHTKFQKRKRPQGLVTSWLYDELRMGWYR